VESVDELPLRPRPGIATLFRGAALRILRAAMLCWPNPGAPQRGKAHSAKMALSPERLRISVTVNVGSRVSYAPWPAHRAGRCRETSQQFEPRRSGLPEVGAFLAEGEALAGLSSRACAHPTSGRTLDQTRRERLQPESPAGLGTRAGGYHPKERPFQWTMCDPTHVLRGVAQRTEIEKGQVAKPWGCFCRHTV